MQTGITLGNIASLAGIQPEEDTLVSELKAGSDAAFAWLIANYHQPIYSLIARLVPDQADAADLTQDVFIKIYRGIGNFHGSSSLRTWIYRIALREASNQRRWWRRHKRQEVTMEAEAFRGGDNSSRLLKDTLVDGGESPFDHAAQEELRSRVEAALRKVPEPFRTAVVLRDIEGFSYEEIAEFLNVNTGTVKSRLMRGRSRLKSALAEAGDSRSPEPVLVSSAVPLLARAKEVR